MFRIFEIEKNVKTEILPKENIYTVHELGNYTIIYSTNDMKSNLFFIEDEVIPEIYIDHSTPLVINLKTHRYFEDYFGFAKISVNSEAFQFNILGEKFELQEIEEIVLYLFEKNHKILHEFISKSSQSGTSIYEGKDYMYSSKYLNLISYFLANFELLFTSFRNLPFTIVRKKFVLSDYHHLTIDSKSLEWVLQNLDSVNFDDLNRKHPDAVEINRNFGIIDKIEAEEKSLSYSSYENEIILGALKHVRTVLSEIKNLIKSRLSQPLIEEGLKKNYVDFRDLKVIPFLRLLSNINDLELQTQKNYVKYQSLFHDAKAKDQFPKLTPVFYKYRHYQKAFELIKMLKNSKYELSGEIQLLNVRKLSELYELYNLHSINDILDNLLIDKGYEKTIEFNNRDIQTSIIYKKINSDKTVTLYFQPLINNMTEGLDIITIGNVKLADKYCKPDYIIEVRTKTDVRYCILDSKYSKISTVRNTHLTSSLKKYIIDVGLKGNPYKKPDHLILLHPDSNDLEEDLIYNNLYYPQISTAISKPNTQSRLIKILKVFIEKDDENNINLS